MPQIRRQASDSKTNGHAVTQQDHGQAAADISARATPPSLADRTSLQDNDSGEKLAISILDIDRLPRLSLERMVVPYTIKKAIQTGQAVEDVGIEFSCPILQAAVICDMIRSEDRKSGDYPTRIYLFNGKSWKRLPDEAVLTRIGVTSKNPQGKSIIGVSLNPQYFLVPAIIAIAPAPKALTLGRKVGE